MTGTAPAAPPSGDIPYDVDGDVPRNFATTSLDRFVSLTERKRRIERELKTVKDDLAPLQDQLLEEFASEGVAGKRHAATGRLVSITRRIWARAADGNKPAAAQALQDIPELAAFSELSFNTNSLSAHFRERARELEEAGTPVTDLAALLPDQLRGLIELTEDHTLSVRS